MLKVLSTEIIILLASLLFLICEISPSMALGEERLISLKPNVTEILFALGLGDQLVGVTSYCDQPPEAQKINRVADYVHVDIEKVLLTKPTLVLGAEENSQKKQVNFLKDRGVRVELFSFMTLEDIRRSIERMGSLLGRESQAKQLVIALNDELKNAKKAKPVRVLLIVGVHPLVAVGGQNNFLHDVVTSLGLINVQARSSMRYPQVGLEDIIALQPEAIIILAMGSEKGKGLEFFKRYPSLEAVKNNHVFELDMNDFRPSPGLVRGIQKMGSILE